MNPRLARQLVYGGIFFTIIFFLVIGIYIRSFKPAPSCFDGKLNQKEEEIDCGGPCVPCAIRHLNRITASAELAPVNDSTNVVIQFANPNIFYGASQFTYTLTLYGLDENKLVSVTHKSFIYPGQFNKTIIETNLPVSSGDVGFAPEVVISNPEWISAQEFSRPQTVVRQKSFVLSNSGDKIEASGIVVNRNPFIISQVDIEAVARREGRIVGVSKTLIQNIDPFGERFFKVVIPVNNGDISGTDIEKTEITINPRR